MERPYSTVAQYLARYPGDADAGVLSECLMDASDAIDVALESAGRTADDVDPHRLSSVCRQVAHRVMPQGADAGVPEGATSLSVTMGPFARSVGYAQPYGSPRLRDDELAALGVSTEWAGYVSPAVP